jgi:hypothetical protein
MIRQAGTALALALTCAAAVRYANRTPAPLPESAPETVFSAGRAMRHLQVIARRQHPAGSDGATAVRAYLMGQLTELGLTPQVQDVTGIGTRFAVAGRVRNVLARVPGTSSHKAVLLVAHYDAVPASMGAGDDGAATVALLETLRALKYGVPLQNDVIALFTDAEENGMLGAAAFVREHPWAKDVAVVLNFEGRGTGGPSLMFQTGDHNLDVARALRAAPDASGTSLSVTVYRHMPNDTDLSELLALGVPAMNFAFIHGVTRYHTAQDDLDHLDAASVQHHGEQMLALARKFGNEQLPRAASPDAVFFALPVLGVISYAEGWSLPLALLAIVLVALVVWRQRRESAGWIRGVAIGATATVLAVVLGAVAAAGVMSALRGFHGARALGGEPAWYAPYAVAVALLVISIAKAVLGFARRYASATSLHAGALAVWALITLIVSATLPGASFLFTVPLLGVGASAFVSTSRPRARSAALWIATVVALFLVVPITYLMAFVALGLATAGVIVLAVLVSLSAWLLLPQLEEMRGNRPFAVCLTALTLAVVLFAWGMVNERTTLSRPTSASFIYAVDADSGGAWLSGYGNPRSATTWLRGAVRQATAGAGRPTSLPHWLTRGFDPSLTRAAPPPRAISTPDVRTTGDSTANGTRRVTFLIRPGPNTLAIYVATGGVAIRSTLIDGKTVDVSRYRYNERWPLQYVAPLDSGFTLTLDVPAGSHGTLGVMSRLQGIPPVDGLKLPDRPAGVIPIQSGDAALVYRRVAF